MNNYTIEQLKDGDEQAWEQAADGIWNNVYSAHVGESEDESIGREQIEEIANDATKAAFGKVQGFKSVEELHGYALTCAHNDVIDFTRKKETKMRREGTLRVSPALHELGEPETVDERIAALQVANEVWKWSCFHSKQPSHAAESKSLHDHLRTGIEKLDAASRTLLQRRFFEGLSEPEIAKLMGVKSGTIGTRLGRAVAKLRRAIGANLLDELRRTYRPQLPGIQQIKPKFPVRKSRSRTLIPLETRRSHSAQPAGLQLV
jgi:RNA polymerase sigma factor (sigma-70 family)